MVLLIHPEYDKSEKIFHYKYFHNPPYICSPSQPYHKHGWMEGLDSTSN